MFSYSYIKIVYDTLDHEFLKQLVNEELSRGSNQVVQEDDEDHLSSTHTEQEDAAAEIDNCVRYFYYFFKFLLPLMPNLDW